MAESLQESDLIYAAERRCACGAGLALAPGSQRWTCADALLGRARGDVEHTSGIPVAMERIPSENDGDGATTRPQARQDAPAPIVAGESAGMVDYSRSHQSAQDGQQRPSPVNTGTGSGPIVARPERPLNVTEGSPERPTGTVPPQHAAQLPASDAESANVPTDASAPPAAQRPVVTSDPDAAEAGSDTPTWRMGESAH